MTTGLLRKVGLRDAPASGARTGTPKVPRPGTSVGHSVSRPCQHDGVNEPPADAPADTSDARPVPPDAAPAAPDPLHVAVGDLERHADTLGWDRPPTLYALVDTAELMAAEPGLSDRLGVDPADVASRALTPVEQESLPDAPLDEVLDRIAWPERVLGCALVHEALVLPPAAEEERPDDADPTAWAAAHPLRQEIRMVAGTLRDGSSACVLRIRPAGDGSGAGGEVAYGDDLAPHLLAALRATLD